MLILVCSARCSQADSVSVAGRLPGEAVHQVPRGLHNIIEPVVRFDVCNCVLPVAACGGRPPASCVVGDGGHACLCGSDGGECSSQWFQRVVCTYVTWTAQGDDVSRRLLCSALLLALVLHNIWHPIIPPPPPSHHGPQSCNPLFIHPLCPCELIKLRGARRCHPPPFT